MQFDDIPDGLQVWLTHNLHRGCSPESIEMELVRSGRDRDFASLATRAAVAAMPTHSSRSGSAPLPAVAMKDGEIYNRLDAGGRMVEISFVLHSPRIVQFSNLLSETECREVVEVARPVLQQSTVVSNDPGAAIIHQDRTSHGASFSYGRHRAIDLLEERIAGLVEIPIGKGEPLQIVRYGPGDQYKPHHDYFPVKPDARSAAQVTPGQRVATLIVYLSRVELGGATVFPSIGLDVLPSVGAALHFAYVTEGGRLDPRTLHGGRPVEKGEKWIATKWYRMEG